MKKNLIKVVSMLFLGSLLVTACKKDKNSDTSNNNKNGENQQDGNESGS